MGAANQSRGISSADADLNHLAQLSLLRLLVSPVAHPQGLTITLPLRFPLLHTMHTRPSNAPWPFRIHPSPDNKTNSVKAGELAPDMAGIRSRLALCQLSLHAPADLENPSMRSSFAGRR